MSVVSVQPKDFILALFIRDDGERFLLGDNGYDFTDSQLHFAANTIENDEVEKQGADGTMLAGQVRRASVQTFDGYVGDATTPKEEIEQMRRAFIAFFLKGHHYRVIYVDCARNAWQRKGGYLVDAPEVKELFQVHPEYHVGLNFEDVNYYSYDENAEGDEITANLVQVAISSAVEGGLVWDEDGAVSEDAVVEYDTESATASGANISINDAVMAPIVGFGIKGNTVQSGTPTPDAPVAVQTVTGENVVKISDGQGNEQSYEVNLGKNLFDVSSITERTAATTNGTENHEVTYSTNNNRAVTLIKVEPNTQYKLSIGDTSYSSRIYFVGMKSTTLESGHSFSWCTSGATLTTNSKDVYLLGVIEALQGGTVSALTNAKIQLEKGSTATSYAPYFTPIELCKIGTYQDSIYKSEGKWYVHKETNKFVLNGTEPWTFTTNGNAWYISNWASTNGVVAPSSNADLPLIYCDSFTPITRDDTATSSYGIGMSMYNALNIKHSGYATSGSNFTGWLSNNNQTIYVARITPTNTEITNATLIAQLEAILSQGYTYAGTNNITTVISAGNEQGELEVEYYTRYDFTITAGGYEWEQGGSGGPTIVMNESIDNVYPIWTITGPITNPVLENTTTGEQIEYVGTIGDGQTLVIDMGAQTALLDGLNVVANIVGEFLSLAPGSNTLIYSVDSGDKASEIGWSEIVG